jgi:hypothetical protein
MITPRMHKTDAVQQALVRFCERPDVAYKNLESGRSEATIAGQYNPFLGSLHRRFFYYGMWYTYA